MTDTMTNPVGEMLAKARDLIVDHRTPGGNVMAYATPDKALVYATLAVAEALMEINATLESLLPNAGRGI